MIKRENIKFFYDNIISISPDSFESGVIILNKGNS